MFSKRTIVVIELIAAGWLYWVAIRRWFARWGTSPEERTRVMPGDYLIASPTDVATQAVTIDAPPGRIWPWLVQMGYGRGGLYSYDWLDLLFGFLDRPSASRIMAEFQDLAVGDEVSLGPRQTLTVAAIDPNRALVLSSTQHGMEWVWQFGLYPIDAGHTRLVSRGSERVPRSVAAWIGMRVMEPAAFIMTRRMLLGVKERAEGTAA